MVFETLTLREQIQRIAADRHSPEAKSLFAMLAEYCARRVQRVVRTNAPTLLSASDQEDIVAEVMIQMVQGSLLSFRGETVRQLLAFTRTVTDRCIWRAIKKARRKQQIEQLADERPVALSQANQERMVIMMGENPLTDEDERYLEALIAAGSKAELARQRGSSRAAITQRVQRIQSRIEKMNDRDRCAVEVWMEHQARASIQASAK